MIVKISQIRLAIGVFSIENTQNIKKGWIFFGFCCKIVG